MSDLVIVESPAKAKTIKKYLGAGYEVIASMGHVRDLLENRLSVDIKKNFTPKYEIIKGKEKVVEALKEAASDSDQVILATDPDREGEAISWHLAYILNLNPKEQNRVTFNEITKTGVKNGMESPRTIDADLVNAQQARRILDRLVGYKLSPFVSQKIRRGLSAGRVQSVAVRLIVDREEEIRKFVPEEYWTIDAKLISKGERKAFPATFYGDQNGKFKIENEEKTNQILSEIEGKDFVVAKVKKGTRRKSPAPPFITSTLQQEASRKLGFQSRRTMKIAQELYEGVDVAGMGAVGLITYMRTDSLRLSQDALDEAAEYIRERYGDKYLPEKRRVFKTRAGAQDGHEAIRPTMPNLTPNQAKESLTSDQYKLYKLIWERFIACQMANCLQSTTQADIEVDKYLFKASGYTVTFDGFTVLYVEGRDEEVEAEGALPALQEGMNLRLREIAGNQHFTQAPPRYTEATLIKKLEENGIGRPSTYASTITTIIGREYVVREAKQLKPTELGEVTTALMKDRFPNIVNEKFTAQMEKQLDSVESGETEWVQVLDDFYGDFESTLKKAKEEMKDVKLKLTEEETDFICEKCGRRMVIKTGRFGKFIACPGYPECKNVKKIVKETQGDCPKCGAKIIERKTKRGRIFFGCASYPACDFSSWDEPSPEKCPKCGKTLFIKKGKVPKLYCATESCGYEKAAEKVEKKPVAKTERQ